MFHAILPPTDDIGPSTILAGFVAAHLKVHQSVIQLSDDVRMKMAQLPEGDSIDSVDSCHLNNGWLVKACHDSVTQLQILLERYTRFIEEQPSAAICDLCAMHSKFHQRIDSLLRMVSTIDNLFGHLEQADLIQIKCCASALEAQAKAYAQLMEHCDEVLVCDMSFAVSMILKIVAERKRMTLLRRGRDISYSPLPARLLASTSRKRISPFDDTVESDVSDCSIESVSSHFFHSMIAHDKMYDIMPGLGSITVMFCHHRLVEMGRYCIF